MLFFEFLPKGMVRVRMGGAVDAEHADGAGHPGSRRGPAAKPQDPGLPNGDGQFS